MRPSTPKTNPELQSSEPVDGAANKTSTVAPPQRLLLEIQADCQSEPAQYLEETVVPHGGE